MAQQTSGDIEIDAPTDRIMAVITDFEAYPEWVTGIKTAEIRQRDARGRAIEVAFEVSQAGVGAKYTLVYVYGSGGRSLSWTTSEASGAVKDIQGEYVLEPAAPVSTKVTYRTQIDLAIPLMGFMKRQAEKIIITTALEGLKKRVEGSPPG